MTLPVFDAVDQVPEPFRPFAREADGKVVLDLVPGADVVGLKRHRDQVLDELKTLKARFADVDVDEYRSLKASGGKVKDLDARLQTAAENEKKALERAQSLASRLKAQAKQAEVTKALAAAGANVALLGPLVAGMVDVEEAGEDLHVVVRDAQGQVRYKDGAGTRFGVADLLQELKTRDEYKPAFNVPVGSGGGAVPSGAGGARVIPGSDGKAVEQAILSGDWKAGKVKIDMTR